jgi:hypothetical protein
MDSYIEFEEQEEYYKEHGLYPSTVKKLEQINNIDDKGERLEALKKYAKQQIEDAEIREANDAYTDGIDFDLINDLERENPED